MLDSGNVGYGTLAEAQDIARRARPGVPAASELRDVNGPVRHPGHDQGFPRATPRILRNCAQGTHPAFIVSPAVSWSQASSRPPSREWVRSDQAGRCHASYAKSVTWTRPQHRRSSRTGRSPATWPGRDGIRSPAGAARTRRCSCPCSLRTQASDKAGEDGAIRNLAHIWPDPRPSKADVSSYPVKFGDDPLNPRQISIRQRQINNMPDTIAHGIDRGGPSARSTTYALVHFGHRSLVTSTDADETGQSPRGQSTPDRSASA